MDNKAWRIEENFQEVLQIKIFFSIYIKILYVSQTFYYFLVWLNGACVKKPLDVGLILHISHYCFCFAQSRPL